MAISIRFLFAALICALFLLAFSHKPAAALPLGVPIPVATPATAPAHLAGGGVLGVQKVGRGVQKVGWRHHRRHHRYHRRHYRHHRHYYRHGPRFSFGFGGPFLVPYVGVPPVRYGYRPGYTYGYAPVLPRRYARPRVGSPDWYAYCASKYRSFNPRTGLYRTYSGHYRRCH